jgi:hypothetical protein
MRADFEAVTCQQNLDSCYHKSLEIGNFLGSFSRPLLGFVPKIILWKFKLRYRNLLSRSLFKRPCVLKDVCEITIKEFLLFLRLYCKSLQSGWKTKI